MWRQDPTFPGETLALSDVEMKRIADYLRSDHGVDRDRPDPVSAHPYSARALDRLKWDVRTCLGPEVRKRLRLYSSTVRWIRGAYNANHAYLIGLTSGFLSFIPYLGLLTGLVLSVSLALIQYWPNWSLIPVILCIFVLGQLVADYALAPRLVGARVKLS
jgi:hypothetical protein